MAAKTQTTTFKPTVKVSRPGVHAKTKTSKIKTSKLYKKNIKDKVNNMEDWELTIELHWPHDRFALGWDYIAPDRTYNYSTVRLYLFLLHLR